MPMYVVVVMRIGKQIQKKKYTQKTRNTMFFWDLHFWTLLAFGPLLQT